MVAKQSGKRSLVIPTHFHDELVKFYLKGKSLNELAAKYKVSQWSIKNVLVMKGVPTRRRGNKVRVFSEEEKNKILRLYSKGWSQEQIALKMGTHQIKVGRTLNAAGVYTGMRRDTHPQWKGGRVELNGYIHIKPEHGDKIAALMANSLNYVSEHRLMMARKLGRALLPSETVHHINGNISDNRPENLQLRQGMHGKHVAHKCLDCGSTNIASTKLAEFI